MSIFKIIVFTHVVLALSALILTIVEYVLNKEDFGTGAIFIFVLLLCLSPILGILLSIALTLDAIKNIKKHCKISQEENHEQYS